ncbi:MAG TPA: hypothetical protein VF765_17360 [Polyangiaceae bacterium]
MNRRTLYSLFACALASAPGCNIYGSGTCSQPQVVSDSSHATANYVTAGPEVADDGGASTSSGDVTGLTLSAQSPNTVAITGSLSSGQYFVITIPNVQGSGSHPLDAQSEVCDSEAGASCALLSGTIETTSFDTQCGSGACALSIAGTLKATSTWMGASFSVDVAMNHHETLRSYTCSEGS